MHHFETTRLVLTTPADTDLDDLFALSSMPEVNIHNPDGPDTDISQSLERLTAWIADWHDNGIGYHTVRDREGYYIGYVGVTFREFQGERRG